MACGLAGRAAQRRCMRMLPLGETGRTSPLSTLEPVACCSLKRGTCFPLLLLPAPLKTESSAMGDMYAAPLLPMLRRAAAPAIAALSAVICCCSGYKLCGCHTVACCPACELGPDGATTVFRWDHRHRRGATCIVWTLMALRGWRLKAMRASLAQHNSVERELHCMHERDASRFQSSKHGTSTHAKLFISIVSERHVFRVFPNVLPITELWGAAGLVSSCLWRSAMPQNAQAVSNGPTPRLAHRLVAARRMRHSKRRRGASPSRAASLAHGLKWGSNLQQLQARSCSSQNPSRLRHRTAP